MDTSRRALLVLDLQKEFLDPSCGRCLLLGASVDQDEQPTFLQNIELLLSRFRQIDGDIIWVRTLADGKRIAGDNKCDETILIVNSEDKSPSGHNHDTITQEQNSRNERHIEPGALFSSEEKRIIKDPIQTDAFLSIDSNLSAVAGSGVASEWADSAIEMMNCPPDCTLEKSGYSAFKDTPLLNQLRGRFVTQLYICGLMTNVGVLATAADAARHGFETRILSDCLGYRSQIAHERALILMEEDYGVESMNSMSLLRASTRGKDRRRGVPTPMSAVGAIAISRDELAALVEGLKLNPQAEPAPRETPEREFNQAETTEQERHTSSTGTCQSYPENIEHNLNSESRQYKQVEVKTAEDCLQFEIGGENHLNETGYVQPDPFDLKLETVEISHNEWNNAQDTPGTSTSDRSTKSSRCKKHNPSNALLEEGAKLGEGDSSIFYEILPETLSKTVFQTLKEEVEWKTMFHRGGEVPRLVAVQGNKSDDGSFPIYRHPADESPPLLPFTAIVNIIRDRIENFLSQKFNHVLIQCYRDGNDYISEHSDKTIDIAHRSKIVNVSIGAQRTMCLRAKKDSLSSKSGSTAPPRHTQRVPMPHNSMFVLGLETNKKWLHGIKQDRRMSDLKIPAELSFNGERISLTFRCIETFLSKDEDLIWGQGAVSKTQENAGFVINGNSESAQKLLEAFGKENHNSDFDWETCYGGGFDVLHFDEPCPTLLFRHAESVPTAQVKLCLYEKQIKFREHIVPPQQSGSLLGSSPGEETPVLIDIDPERTTLFHSLAILQYLETFYAPLTEDGPWLLPSVIDDRSAYAVALDRIQATEKLHRLSKRDVFQDMFQELDTWETYLKRSQFAGGNSYSLVDVALYPVILKIKLANSNEFRIRFPHVEQWESRTAARESVKKVYQSSTS